MGLLHYWFIDEGSCCLFTLSAESFIDYDLESFSYLGVFN